MRLWFTFLAACVSAVLFGGLVPLARFFEIFQPLVVALSIMIAAILVRLNRGMPTLDWKSLALEERIRLTAKILDLTKEYLIVISIITVFLCITIALMAIGKIDVANVLSDRLQEFTSGGLGFFIALLLSRMGYIVWRDYDIVRLQKKLIDDSGLKEKSELETKTAEGKISDIRSANMRRIGNGDITPWT